jgi:hypothetical protein
MGLLSAHFIGVLADVVAGHTKTGHAGLVGEAVGAHLKVDEALAVAILVFGLSH